MTARAAEMKPEILVADDWRDYRLLDSGDGEKLEQVGPYRVVRPEPQALWTKQRAGEWSKADAVFTARITGQQPVDIGVEDVDLLDAPRTLGPVARRRHARQVLDILAEKWAMAQHHLEAVVVAGIMTTRYLYGAVHP